MIRQIAIVSLLLSSAPALAATQKPDQPTSADKKRNPDRPICKTIQKTGTRLGGERICMTAREWEEQRRSSRKVTEEGQAKSSH
jgi:hypothetical protein